MESHSNDGQSFFDLLEEKSEKPEIFDWQTDKNLFKYNEEERLFVGTLLSIKKSPNKIKKHLFLLTLQSLIKYKVKFMFNLIESKGEDL